jgi:hypothetical protein
VEFRFKESSVVFSSPEGIRLQPASEIHYQKMVERIVEGGDWKKKKSVEQLREGGEGRRNPGSGPMA